MKRLLRVVIPITVIVAIAIALKMTVFKAAPISVTVHRVNSGRVETIVVNSKAGTIRSRQRAQLSPAVSGRVIELGIRKGDRVTKGQLLLRLDDEEYRAQVSQADRALAVARAAERQSTIEADQALREMDRHKTLVADGAIAASAFEALESRRKGALAAVDAARERARQSGAALDAARAAMEKTRILAPFDGVVADLSTELGEWLSPSPPGVNIPAVIDLVDLDSVYVSAPLDEVDLARVHVGLATRVTVDAHADKTFPGTVTRVAAYVADRLEQNRTFEVEVDFIPPGLAASAPSAETSVEKTSLGTIDALDAAMIRARDFVPGSTADVEIILDFRENALRIPTYAILEGGKVLVVRAGILVAIPVKKGISNWQYTEITDGLSAGEAVVISLDRAEVKEGAEVVATEETEKVSGAK